MIHKVKSKMKLKIISLIIVALLVVGSLYMMFTANFENDDVTDENVPSENEESPATGNITSFDQQVNDFCFDLFKKIQQDKNNQDNLFYSPYSVFTALAMTYEGARNNTASEMADVLSVEQDNETFHQYMKSLYKYLNENSEYNISTANALWPKVGFNLLTEYTKVIEKYYGGNSTSVNYSNPEEAAGIINSWVENKTNNLIKNLVPASAINPTLTRLILTNAIYFKGTWQIQFDEKNTTEREFLNSDGETIQVDTMKLVDTENLFNYTETEDLQILELGYKGDDLSMIIILPKNNETDLTEIVNSLNKENYTEWVEQMTQREVDIYLPKFKYETKYTLNNYLKDLGISEAFTTNADFSGMDGRKDLMISSVLHKAFVEVKEEGTEAAAATAVVMDLTAIEPIDEPERIVFDCDHPFLFTINHKETGTILFIGEVIDPSK